LFDLKGIYVAPGLIVLSASIFFPLAEMRIVFFHQGQKD